MLTSIAPQAPSRASQTPDPTPLACQATCRAILRQGSKSFFAASQVLPKRLRAPAAAIYAFCREADDAIDSIEAASPIDHRTQVKAALARLERRLDYLYDTPSLLPYEKPCAVDQALKPVVHTYLLPRALFAALLEGFAWDAEGRQYQTFSQLRMYAARVAASVGTLMTLLMGERRPAVLARACDLGVAMQLTNIARDVGEDARNGRLYLPHDWLREAGIAPQDLLAQPQHSPQLASVIKRLLAEAEMLYRRSEVGIAYLPADCRMAICAARRIYADIGRKLARLHYNSVQLRAVVSLPRKLWILLRSLAARFWRPAPNQQPCLDETAFLVMAAHGPQL
jgi:phytoene synthase